VSKIKFQIVCIFTVVVLIAFILGCQSNNISITSLEDGKVGTIKFPTRNVTGFQDMVIGEKAFNSKSIGTLYLPTEASKENKVAVMVILHGSGGEWSGRGRTQAEFLMKNGIGAFVIDTFEGRGLKKKDKYIQRLMKANFPDQLTDAFAALDLLQTHPLIDGNRIGVMGYSMGGISTILSSFEKIASSCTKTNIRFALHVSFYAPCIILPQEGEKTTGAPFVGLWGNEDETTPKSRCVELIEYLRNGGSLVREIWYPNAAHGWNGNTPMKFYKDVPNFSPCRFTILSDGSIIEKMAGKESITDEKMIENSEYCVEFGYTIGRHETTHEQANEILLETIKTYMPNPWK
jgi:dienelactone hydrolase